MRIRAIFLTAALAAALASPAAAQVATKKFPWQPVGGVQDIDVQTENVVVGQVVFDLGSTLKGTPIRKSSAKVRVRIDNNSETDEEVGVAVVVFDAEGNVVAAGSNGTKWGYLNEGRPDVLQHRLPVRVPAPRPGGQLRRFARDAGQGQGLEADLVARARTHAGPVNVASASRGICGLRPHRPRLARMRARPQGLIPRGAPAPAARTSSLPSVGRLFAPRAASRRAADLKQFCS